MSAQTQIAAGLARVAAAVVALAGRTPPAGGTTGQVLTKVSANDHDTSWQTPAAGGGGSSSPILPWVI